MRRRLFLMALVAALMLILAALRAALMATPFTGGSTWGGYSFWELRHSLPQGVFRASLLLICCAAFSLCMQAALKLAQGKARNLITLRSVASANLWCGIPALACCTLCIPLIFPPETICTPSESPFEVLGVISSLLILCFLTARFRHSVFAWLCLPVSLLSLLVCGELQSQAITILPGTIFLASGMTICRAKLNLALAAGLCVLGTGIHAVLTCPELTSGIAYAATLLSLAPALYIKLTTRQG